MMQEIVQEANMDLNNALRYLNNFFISLSNSLGKPENGAKTEQYLKSFFSKIERKGNLLNLMVEYHNNIDGNFIASKPEKLFSYFSDQQFVTLHIGDITNPSTLIYNDGLVIGLKFKYKKLMMEYRLDYDNTKLLHFNLILQNGNKSFVFAISKIKDPKNYFDFDKTSDKYHELVKYKFFFKMTFQSIISGIYPVDANKFQEICEKIPEFSSIEALEIKEQRDSIIANLTQLYTEYKPKPNKIHSTEVSMITLPDIDSDTKNATDEKPNKKQNEKTSIKALSERGIGDGKITNSVFGKKETQHKDKDKKPEPPKKTVDIKTPK